MIIPEMRDATMYLGRVHEWERVGQWVEKNIGTARDFSSNGEKERDYDEKQNAFAQFESKFARGPASCQIPQTLNLKS